VPLRNYSRTLTPLDTQGCANCSSLQGARERWSNILCDVFKRWNGEDVGE